MNGPFVGRQARYVGIEGKVLGVGGFGTSAPYEVLAEKYGFTPSAIVECVNELARTR